MTPTAAIAAAAAVVAVVIALFVAARAKTKAFEQRELSVRATKPAHVSSAHAPRGQQNMPKLTWRVFVCRGCSAMLVS